MDINEYMKNNKKVIKTAFKSILIDLRKKSGLSQQNISEYLMIDISKIRNYEYLKTDSFDITALYIMKFLMKTPNALMENLIKADRETRKKAIIEALQDLRKDANIRIEDIADRYAVPYAYLYLFEDGLLTDEYPLIMYIDYIFLGGNKNAEQ